MVRGHTLVRSAVTLFNVSYQQPSIPCGLGSCRQVRPAHPAPRELDGMRPMGKTLYAQGVARVKSHLVRQAGGVWRSCMKEKTINVPSIIIYIIIFIYLALTNL